MTNKKAIDLIIRNKSVFQYDEDMLKALELAIKALKDRTQEDNYNLGFGSDRVCIEHLNDKDREHLLNKIRPQGEWINHRNDNGHNIADCSLCGKTMQWHDEDKDGIPRYCWYCGAKMKGGAKND